MAAPPSRPMLDGLKEVIRRHWGFGSFRPLQEPAMRAVLEGRDSLVVLPTGGGKSLCYQAPAVYRGDTTVVVSPLISLMKDQVDSLKACGVPAIQIDSFQSANERYAHEQQVLEGAVRLLFVSPERLANPGFLALLQRSRVRSFAIDEAHCISHWGHDFRPEYRQLAQLRVLFPHASIHAFTATATERVRRDIIDQLRLRDPDILIGNFDRPNLTYRVFPRQDLLTQVREVLDRHKGEAGIIYCLRRLDVDDLADNLRRHGYRALPYHAGMEPEQRKATQDAFANEQCDLVVATIAFGMGIDRSNIRFVLHASVPKSIEHYQQETGRAGRDGLEAECVLLYSAADIIVWERIITRSATESKAAVDPSFLRNAIQHLRDMDRYCQGAVCRHRALVEYFGQQYEPQTCAACDICLGDAEPVPNAVVVAQKILSCVARVKERFGVGHVIDVLRGRTTEKVVRLGHDRLSTFGLLQDQSDTAIRDWVYQLIGQSVLMQEEVQLENGVHVPILKLNGGSWEVMKGQRSVRLLQPVRRARGERPQRSRADAASWEGVDRELFELLRELRRQRAEERSVPPYVIFSDATLRKLAQVRPSSLEQMRRVYGIGEAKLRDHGPAVLEVILRHSASRRLPLDVGLAPTAEPFPAAAPGPTRPSQLPKQLAFELFEQNTVIEDVMHQTRRSRSRVIDYLCDFIRQTRPGSVAAWVGDDTYQRIAAAVRQVGSESLRPIFLALNEQVSYDDIRIVVAHLESRGLAGRFG